jgi:hypothetical protein
MLIFLINRLDFMLRGRSNPRGGVMSGDLLLPPIVFLIIVSLSLFPPISLSLFHYLDIPWTHIYYITLSFSCHSFII